MYGAAAGGRGPTTRTTCATTTRNGAGRCTMTGSSSRCSPSRARRRGCRGRPSCTSAPATAARSRASTRARWPASTPARRAALLQDPGIVRNRLKIDSTVTNARAFLAVQHEFGSFDRYLWSFVGGRPLINRPRPRERARPHRAQRPDLPGPDESVASASSARPSSMPTCRPSGVVNDHSRDCFRCPPRRRSGRAMRAARKSR